MNKFLKFLESVFRADQGTISSKRVAGVVGWVVALIIILYCTFSHTEAPSCFVEFMAFSAGLLGWDSFTGIWKGENRNINHKGE